MSFLLQLPPPWQYTPFEMKHNMTDANFEAFLDPAVFDDNETDHSAYQHVHHVGPLVFEPMPSVASASSPSSSSDSAQSSTSTSSSTTPDLLGMPASIKVASDGSSSVVLPLTSFPYPGAYSGGGGPHSTTYILPNWVPSAVASSSSTPTLGSLSGPAQRSPNPASIRPLPFSGGKARSCSAGSVSSSSTSRSRRASSSNSPPRSRSPADPAASTEERRQEKLGWLQRLQQAEDDAQKHRVASASAPLIATSSSPRAKSFSMQGITFP